MSAAGFWAAVWLAVASLMVVDAVAGVGWLVAVAVFVAAVGAWGMDRRQRRMETRC